MFVCTVARSSSIAGLCAQPLARSAARWRGPRPAGRGCGRARRGRRPRGCRPGACRRRASAGSGRRATMSSPAAGEHRADRRAEPLRERDRDEVERRGERRPASTPRRDRGVEQPRAVEVASRRRARAPRRRSRSRLGCGNDRGRRRGCACSRPRPASSAGRRTWPGGLRAARNVVGGEQPAAADLGELHAGVRRARRPSRARRRGLSRPTMTSSPGRVRSLQRELVGHRAARHEERRLLAEQRGDPLLQRG